MSFYYFQFVSYQKWLNSNVCGQLNTHNRCIISFNFNSTLKHILLCKDLFFCLLNSLIGVRLQIYNLYTRCCRQSPGENRHFNSFALHNLHNALEASPRSCSNYGLDFFSISPSLSEVLSLRKLTADKPYNSHQTSLGFGAA